MNYTVAWRFNDKTHTITFDSYCQAISYYSKLEAMRMRPSLHSSEAIVVKPLVTEEQIKWN